MTFCPLSYTEAEQAGHCSSCYFADTCDEARYPDLTETEPLPLRDRHVYTDLTDEREDAYLDYNGIY